jgi:hypothetical protein
LNLNFAKYSQGNDLHNFYVNSPGKIKSTGRFSISCIKGPIISEKMMGPFFDKRNISLHFQCVSFLRLIMSLIYLFSPPDCNCLPVLVTDFQPEKVVAKVMNDRCLRTAKELQGIHFKPLSARELSLDDFLV